MDHYRLYISPKNGCLSWEYSLNMSNKEILKRFGTLDINNINRSQLSSTLFVSFQYLNETYVQPCTFGHSGVKGIPNYYPGVVPGPWFDSTVSVITYLKRVGFTLSNVLCETSCKFLLNWVCDIGII